MGKRMFTRHNKSPSTSLVEARVAEPRGTLTLGLKALGLVLEVWWHIFQSPIRSPVVVGTIVNVCSPAYCDYPVIPG